ncbi:MFS transporter [Pseudophaeobacter sp. 1A16562]|uniref:MFS transporter n=1 Tax=Pseudophaeobacter sp. 1A16562 TaxID=3098143 RepID=UPI0034D65D63
MTLRSENSLITATLIIGAFLVVSVEFVVVGLAEGLSSSLAINTAQYSLVVSVFAIGAAFGGPALAYYLARFPPRRVLVWSLAPFVGNLAFAFSPDLAPTLALRAIQGATLPVFMSFANVWMAQRYGTGHGTSLLYTGVVAGGALSPPIGASLAALVGWKSVMFGLGLFCLLVMAAIYKCLDERGPQSSPLQRVRTFDGYLLGHLTLTVLTFAALFASYAHIAQILNDAGIQPEAVNVLLLVFGVAGFAGNWLAAKAVKWPFAASCCATGLVALCSLAVQAEHNPETAMAVTIAATWGGAHAASFVLSQARLMNAAPQFPAFAGSLNISAGNIGIALGSVLGGFAVSPAGTGVSTGTVTSVLAILSIILAGLMAGRKVAMAEDKRKTEQGCDI